MHVKTNIINKYKVYKSLYRCFVLCNSISAENNLITEIFLDTEFPEISSTYTYTLCHVVNH